VHAGLLSLRYKNERTILQFQTSLPVAQFMVYAFNLLDFIRGVS
jgi:hypothetical protein